MNDYQRIMQWVDDDYVGKGRFTPAERSLLSEVADRLKHNELRAPEESCVHSFFNRRTRTCIKCDSEVPTGSYISESMGNNG